MPRRPRIFPAGICFHVLNRAVARLPLFENQEDYLAFERVLEEAVQRAPLSIFAYCVMPNHWHFVARGETDHQLSDFFRWLTHTHTMRWHAHHRTGGTGHLYQGRFKTFPIEEDGHLLPVLRYVEGNPRRANLCEIAEQWRYSSAWRRTFSDGQADGILALWPIPQPPQWRHAVNQPQNAKELEAIRRSLSHGTPFGSNAWVRQAADQLQLKHTLRPRGRPKNEP